MTTYNEVLIRAKESARDAMPELPEKNTCEAWQAFQESVESIDVYDSAHIEADSWDTVIYHYKAMALCTDVPSGVLHNAESQWDDTTDEKPAGLYELASSIAYWVVQSELIDAMESLQAELIELAENQIEQFQ